MLLNPKSDKELKMLYIRYW